MVEEARKAPLFFWLADLEGRAVQYRLKERGGEESLLAESLAPVVGGLGLALVEFSLTRSRGSISVKAAVFKKDGVGIDDCAKAHRAIMPRLELALGTDDIAVEVSSPGIARLLKEGADFHPFVGCPVKCWVTALSDWKTGILESVTETYIMIKGKDGMEKLDFKDIAKAKLDSKAAR
jgi:ribosome maturation factor RimP